MCATDCGRCIDCIETDDYGPAWRNPRFREPVSDVEASGALGDGQGAARPSESTHICTTTLTRDGGEPQ